MAQTVHDRTQISPGRQIVQEGRCGCRNVSHRHGKVSGQGNRRRASARKHHGELGFLTPNNRRTMTIECIEDGQVLTITYERLLEIYFQNPQFGYYFLVLTSQRLLDNNQRLQEDISRLEATLAQEKAARQTAAAHGVA